MHVSVRVCVCVCSVFATPYSYFKSIQTRPTHDKFYLVIFLWNGTRKKVYASPKIDKDKFSCDNFISVHVSIIRTAQKKSIWSISPSMVDIELNNIFCDQEAPPENRLNGNSSHSVSTKWIRLLKQKGRFLSVEKNPKFYCVISQRSARSCCYRQFGGCSGCCWLCLFDIYPSFVLT